jgi:hypothetical protein
MQTANLIHWIDNHDTAAPTFENADGTLTVSSWCVQTNLPVGHPDRVFMERAIIPATLSAARAHLGY